MNRKKRMFYRINKLTTIILLLIMIILSFTGCSRESKIERLIKDLKSKDTQVQDKAAEELAKMGEPAVESLIEVLKDENLNVRLISSRILSETDDIRIIEPLIEALKDEESNVRMYAERGLKNLGSSSVEALINALRNDDKNVRIISSRILSETDDIRIIEPLIEAMKDENEKVNMYAKKGLFNIGESAIDQLIANLTNENINIRLGAVQILSVTEDARIIEPLKLALNDEDSNVRIFAERGLKNMGVAITKP